LGRDPHQEIHHLNLNKIRDVLVETTMAAGAVHQRILVTMERVTVTVLEMAVLMMVTLGAREILCVEATTAKSLDLTSMRRMIAVIFLSLCKPQHLNLRLLLGPLSHLHQVKSVLEETTMARDVVPPRIPVMKERVTVMDQEMVV